MTKASLRLGLDVTHIQVVTSTVVETIVKITQIVHMVAMTVDHSHMVHNINRECMDMATTRMYHTVILTHLNLIIINQMFSRVGDLVACHPSYD